MITLLKKTISLFDKEKGGHWCLVWKVTVRYSIVCVYIFWLLPVITNAMNLTFNIEAGWSALKNWWNYALVLTTHEMASLLSVTVRTVTLRHTVAGRFCSKILCSWFTLHVHDSADLGSCNEWFLNGRVVGRYKCKQVWHTEALASRLFWKC